MPACVDARLARPCAWIQWNSSSAQTCISGWSRKRSNETDPPEATHDSLRTFMDVVRVGHAAGYWQHRRNTEGVPMDQRVDRITWKHVRLDHRAGTHHGPADRDHFFLQPAQTDIPG